MTRTIPTVLTVVPSPDEGRCYGFLLAGMSSVFSVSPVKTEGPNDYSEPEENSAPGREVPRVRLSPTMRYSGMELFAPKVQ